MSEKTYRFLTDKDDINPGDQWVVDIHGKIDENAWSTVEKCSARVGMPYDPTKMSPMRRALSPSEIGVSK